MWLLLWTLAVVTLVGYARGQLVTIVRNGMGDEVWCENLQPFECGEIDAATGKIVAHVCSSTCTASVHQMWCDDDGGRIVTIAAVTKTCDDIPHGYFESYSDCRSRDDLRPGTDVWETCRSKCNTQSLCNSNLWRDCSNGAKTFQSIAGPPRTCDSIELEDCTTPHYSFSNVRGQAWQRCSRECMGYSGLPCDLSQAPTTSLPSNSPSTIISENPTDVFINPSESPSINPSESPSINPTVQSSSLEPTTMRPSQSPTDAATLQPSGMPSDSPTQDQSQHPSEETSQEPSGPWPTETPTKFPTTEPSVKPTVISSNAPTRILSVEEPSQGPSLSPSVMQSSLVPSSEPSEKPSLSPSHDPSLSPSGGQSSPVPSNERSEGPSLGQSHSPSLSPSVVQSSPVPSSEHSQEPSMRLSQVPSMFPTGVQSSPVPSSEHSQEPNIGQSPSPEPSVSPSENGPTDKPSTEPSNTIVLNSSTEPSLSLLRSPSQAPSLLSSQSPSNKSSDTPSLSVGSSPMLTSIPTKSPMNNPSQNPSLSQSIPPTRLPWLEFSQRPSQSSEEPSLNPLEEASPYPTGVPSGKQTTKPTGSPNMNPIGRPSQIATQGPTFHPSERQFGVQTKSQTPTISFGENDRSEAPFRSAPDTPNESPFSQSSLASTDAPSLTLVESPGGSSRPSQSLNEATTSPLSPVTTSQNITDQPSGGPPRDSPVALESGYDPGTAPFPPEASSQGPSQSLSTISPRDGPTSVPAVIDTPSRAPANTSRQSEGPTSIPSSNLFESKPSPELSAPEVLPFGGNETGSLPPSPSLPSRGSDTMEPTDVEENSIVDISPTGDEISAKSAPNSTTNVTEVLDAINATRSVSAREVEFGQLFAGTKIDETYVTSLSFPQASLLSENDVQAAMTTIDEWLHRVYGIYQGRKLVQSQADLRMEVSFVNLGMSIDQDGNSICTFRYRQRVLYTLTAPQLQEDSGLYQHRVLESRSAAEIVVFPYTDTEQNLKLVQKLRTRVPGLSGLYPSAPLAIPAVVFGKYSIDFVPASFHHVSVDPWKCWWIVLACFLIVFLPHVLFYWCSPKMPSVPKPVLDLNHSIATSSTHSIHDD